MKYCKAGKMKQGMIQDSEMREVGMKGVTMRQRE